MPRTQVFAERTLLPGDGSARRSLCVHPPENAPDRVRTHAGDDRRGDGPCREGRLSFGRCALLCLSLLGCMRPLPVARRRGVRVEMTCPLPVAVSASRDCRCCCLRRGCGVEVLTSGGIRGSEEGTDEDRGPSPVGRRCRRPRAGRFRSRGRTCLECRRFREPSLTNRPAINL